ncbi:hypothetical protein ACFPAF_16895 [Hymenobacter endophyticus]|uniref:Uncharacterized protein n=1 Tax=Hymenobacter endophyticus TaxID=3076335 RepID=A0ABU3TL22_9BACT|nr:hypothetical protein [Hymenobacter endophyticus]MDU0372082.1 hypothetical protein [Hymenobacter endophyticus]
MRFHLHGYLLPCPPAAGQDSAADSQRPAFRLRVTDSYSPRPYLVFHVDDKLPIVLPEIGTHVEVSFDIWGQAGTEAHNGPLLMAWGCSPSPRPRSGALPAFTL